MAPGTPALVLVSGSPYLGRTLSVICYYNNDNYSLTSIVTSESSFKPIAIYNGRSVLFIIEYNNNKIACNYIIIPFMR